MSRQIERQLLSVMPIQHRPIWAIDWVRDAIIGTGIFSIIYLLYQLV